MGVQATQSVLLTSLVTAVIIGAGAYFYKKYKKQKIPTDWEQVGTVKKLYMYPLKSGHMIELEKADCTKVGFRQTKDDEKVLQLRDRGLVVYGAKDNEQRTARTYPKMLLIDVSVHDETHLAIDAPTMRTLYVQIPKREENDTANIKSWSNSKITGIDCGDEAATWFSRYIIERESGLRLAYNDEKRSRDLTKSHQKLLNYYTNLNNDSAGIFSDLTSVMMMSQPSVNHMNTKITSTTIPIENFRPNIIVDGPGLEPYAEDTWDWIKVGDELIMRNVKECTRCMMVTIHHETAIRNPQREPLKTLETYRRSMGPDKSPVMGINLAVVRTGVVKVGDPVFIAKSC